MGIEIQHDTKSGKWSFSFKRHVFVTLGLLLVSSGLLTLSGPWWQGIAVALLSELKVTVNETHQTTLGAVQILLGVGLLTYKHFFVDKFLEKKESDKKTISTSPLNIESVRYYLDHLVDDHSYESSLDIAFHSAFTHFNKVESSLQVKSTRVKYEKFADAAAQLHQFVGVNFFIFPPDCSAEGEYRYCLAPHLNMDREMIIYDPAKVAEYDRLKFELHDRALHTKQLFEKFVGNLKKLGHI